MILTYQLWVSLIQHTFPLPNGDGLRLTVAEFLTPALRHVTKVGGAGYDPLLGHWVGGGVQPDIYCSSQSIPSQVGSDFCVGTAFDALDQADDRSNSRGSSLL